MGITLYTAFAFNLQLPLIGGIIKKIPAAHKYFTENIFCRWSTHAFDKWIVIRLKWWYTFLFINDVYELYSDLVEGFVYRLVINPSLCRIEEELGDKARFAGKNFRKPI